MTSDDLYLYGIVLTPDPALSRALADLAGASVGPPKLIAVEDFGVIVGAHDGSEILQTRRRMTAHTRVLEAAMECATVLPMRFGHIATSELALARLVTPHAETIRQRLDRLVGQVELGVRISFPRQAALEAVMAQDRPLTAARDRLVGRGPEGHFERIELGRRVAEALDRRRSDAQRALLEQITLLCTDHVLRAPEEDTEVLRVELLLPRDDLQSLPAKVHRLVKTLDFAPGAEATIKLVGPAPPFHFADLCLSPTETPKSAPRGAEAA